MKVRTTRFEQVPVTIAENALRLPTGSNATGSHLVKNSHPRRVGVRRLWRKPILQIVLRRTN